MKILNALTVDIEDYFQVSTFDTVVAREDWANYESRVVQNTERLLQLFAEEDVQATFFVLGWVADRFPNLIRSICHGGHEIGSHGYWHRLVYSQQPQEFREDLCRSRDTLQDITGEAIVMYRAPSFSITETSKWALEILADEGFLVDSSIFPIYHDRYGMPDANPRIHRIETNFGSLWEFPPSVSPLLGYQLPVAGGGYFRLYPLSITRMLLRRINLTEQRPFMFYIHPWEIDPQQPRIVIKSKVSRFRHYVNIASTETKLRRLLQWFRFGKLTAAMISSNGSASTTATTDDHHHEMVG